MDRRVTIAARTESTPHASLPADVHASWCRRLAVVALIYSVGYFVVYSYTWLEVVLYETPQPGWLDNLVAVFACLLGLIVHMRCRGCGLSRASFATHALVFQILGAFGIMAGIWGWEHDLSAQLSANGSALAIEPSRLQDFFARSSSWGLGLYEYASVSWVGPWILLFPFVVAISPRRTLIASLLTASVVPLVAGASLFVNGIPEPVRGAIPGFLGRMIVPTYVCAFVAYFGARVIYRLTHDLSQARRIGSYQLVERIGTGGMGEVWRAKHRMLARPAAIKLIRPEILGPSCEGNLGIQRFEREAQATAVLSSPHTIHVYDFGVTEDGRLYYVMELLDGFDLRTLVQKHGPVCAGRAIHFLRQACMSLAEAHADGFIHRDVKPANIFACRNGLEYDFIKVLDFGLVKESDAASHADPHLTLDGVQAGTPYFMAPEMASGSRDVDARADIYALGCVGYWLLTGQLVFDGTSPLAVLIQHAQAEPAPPSTRTEIDVPRALDRVILECLRKDPTTRPASALVLAEQLVEAAGDTPGWALEQARNWWRAHRPQTTTPTRRAAQPRVEMRPACK